MIWLFLVALAFVGAGVCFRPDHPLAAYVVIGFFGLCAVVVAINLLPRSSYLRLTAAGFEICNLFRSRFIAWKDVSRFGVTRVGNREMVGWDPLPPISTLGKTNQALCGYASAFPDTYGLKAEKLAELLNSVRDRHLADRALDETP
jgi:hypothetical protein